MYTTKVEVPVTTTQLVSVVHRFTVGDVVLHRRDGTGPYQPEVILATAQYGNERKLGYVLRPVGSTVAVRISTEMVDRDYDLWLSHLDR